MKLNLINYKTKQRKIIVIPNCVTCVFILSFLIFAGCKHEPLVPGDVTGENNGGGTNGGGNNGGGNNGGGGTGNGLPCDPDSIYFQQQILPFLVTNCAKSGCHNAASQQDGVILDSYNNVMNTGEVEPYDLDDTEIWEVITESDPDKVMPPPGENPLTQAQIDMIAQWVNQGAQNLVCDDGLAPCDSTSLSFVADVQPIIQNKCIGCHSSAHSGNAFIALNNYSGIAAASNTGQLLGAITHNPNYTVMPQNGPMLSACEIGKIRNWINEGVQNN